MSSDAEIFSKEVHRKVIRNFPRRKIMVNGIDNIWSLDLADMSGIRDYNDGYKYILCVIDVFSKYGWCIALKNKSASSVLNAVKMIIQDSGRKPDRIWVDRGSEFYNSDFQSWARKEGIIIYSTYGESKSVVVERFIRTLKEMIMKIFTANNSRNWVRILEKLVKKYNNTVHSTIGITPKEASDPKNSIDVWKRINDNEVQKEKKPKFKVGDQVRISRVKGTFEKGYEPNFSYEVFTVKEVLDSKPITYKVVDYHDNPIEGSFYTQELLKTKVPHYYEIEKVIKTRKRGKKKEYLVKFYGWPSKFNEFLSEDQITDIKH